MSHEGGGKRPLPLPGLALHQVSSIPGSFHSPDPGHATHIESSTQRAALLSFSPPFPEGRVVSDRVPPIKCSWPLSFLFCFYLTTVPSPTHSHLLWVLVPPTAADPPDTLKCHHATTEGHAVGGIFLCDPFGVKSTPKTSRNPCQELSDVVCMVG